MLTFKIHIDAFFSSERRDTFTSQYVAGFYRRLTMAASTILLLLARPQLRYSIGLPAEAGTHFKSSALVG